MHGTGSRPLNYGSIPGVRRRRLSPASDLRLSRLAKALTLSEVAARAGMSLTRASYIERDPAIAKPAELDALKRAINAMSTEREVT